MSYREEFEQETGRECGYNHEICNGYFRDDYVEWLESKLASAEDLLRWRNVEEELPENGQECLVREYHKGSFSNQNLFGTKIAVFQKGDGFFIQGYYIVTHWRPIGPLPQEEK